MGSARRAVFLGTLATASLLLSACTTTSLVLGAVGVATDTSITLAIAQHVHEKLTDGDPVPCYRFDSVHRALSTRCGEYVPGSLAAKDIDTAAMQICPLAMATRDPRLWPVLPELLAKGAQPERCSQSPLLALAQAEACPDFTTASPEVRRSLAWLAAVDARAIQHDVVRLLSCPYARSAGLDGALVSWQASGALQADSVGFGVLGALHPDYLDSPFARSLEAEGHTAQAALGAYQGVRPPGFEEALRTSHWSALDWWLLRRPELANSVPPRQGTQLPWRPLARVLVPSFLVHPETQAELASFLMARGADPQQRLPFDAHRSVLAYARALKSPLVAVLEQPLPAPSMRATTLASRSPTRAPGGAETGGAAAAE